MRWTEERDLPGLFALFETGFGRPMTRQEWEWKYRGLPGEARSAVAVGEDGEVLAHSGVIGLPATWSNPSSARDGSEAGSGAGLLWQTVDFVASPRRGGLRPPVVPLMRWAIEDLPRPGDTPWIIGFPNPRNRALTERVLRSGWLRAIRRWAGELREAAIAPPAQAAPIGLETGDSTLVGGSSGPPSAPEEWVERVWSGCGVHGIRRTAAFLNWRYHRRPQRYYRFYRLTCEAPAGDGAGSAGHEGLAVVAFANSEAALTELWLPPAGDWRGALPAIAADLVASGLERWRMWTPPAGEGALAGLGLRAIEEIHVAYRGRVGQDLAELTARAQSSFYAMGDYDFH